MNHRGGDSFERRRSPRRKQDILASSALHVPRLVVTEVFLKHGAVVTSPDRLGDTTLQWAAGSGEAGVVDALPETPVLPFFSLHLLTSTSPCPV